MLVGAVAVLMQARQVQVVQEAAGMEQLEPQQQGQLILVAGVVALVALHQSQQQAVQA